LVLQYQLLVVALVQTDMAAQAVVATQALMAAVALFLVKDTPAVAGTPDMLVVVVVAPAVEDKITLEVIPAVVAELG
jgi:hypothetical protein